MARNPASGPRRRNGMSGKGIHRFKVTVKGTMRRPGNPKPIPFVAKMRVKANTTSPAMLRRSMNAKLPPSAKVTQVVKDGP